MRTDKFLSNKILFCALIVISTVSCKKYLDIVPDNVATIENAFNLRSQARKYLFTCYSFIPNPGSIGSSPAFLRGAISGRCIFIPEIRAILFAVNRTW